MPGRIYDFYRRVVMKLLREASHKADSIDELCLRIDMMERTIKAVGSNDLTKEEKEELLETLKKAKEVLECKRYKDIIFK